MLGQRNTTPSAPTYGAPKARVSPAIDAMRQTGQPVAASNTARVGVPSASAAPTGTQVPSIPVQQVDTTKMDNAYGQQDAAYGQMLADQQKNWDATQQMIQQNFSSQLTRNASNAARMGLQAGGASYLSGQRSALNQAGNYARQANMDSMNQRLGIQGQQAGAYGQRAGAYGGVASQNTGAQNAANTAQWQRGNEIDDRKAAEQATQNANQSIASVEQVKADFDYLFNEHNLKSGGGQYNSLLTAYKNSLSTGNPQEQTAAYQALMAYIPPIQQAREAWLAAGQPGKFEDFYKKGGAAGVVKNTAQNPFG